MPFLRVQMRGRGAGVSGIRARAGRRNNRSGATAKQPSPRYEHHPHTCSPHALVLLVTVKALCTMYRSRKYTLNSYSSDYSASFHCWEATE